MKRNLLDRSQESDSTSLPAATRERWQPIRGGLLNLYLYDYEEFRYEQGHLILRGNNGTGKSRVMALQLPFLFDGRLSSNRVEPDADPAKRMEWNLLLGRYNDRLGYTWIEFGRLTEAHENNGDQSGDRAEEHDSQSVALTPGGNGHCAVSQRTQRFITLGCGLSATKGGGMRDPWFFITDQRIGADLFLQTDAGHALTKAQLAEALGSRGTVYTTAKEYRQAVDEALFCLGRQRYDAMVDLLIQLRKPQLSRDLDEKMLARVLAEALPPPSEQMIADVAESFRGLESDRLELERYCSARDGVDGFLETYRRYAQVAARRRAAEVRQSNSGYESANKELRQAERDHAEATGQLGAAVVKLRALEINDEELASRLETLRADPKMRSADAIRDADGDQKQAQRDLDTAQQDLQSASGRLEQRLGTQRDARQRAEDQLKKTSDVYRRSCERAEDCEWGTKHRDIFSELNLSLDSLNEVFLERQRDVERRVKELVDKRFQSSKQLKKRIEECDDAEREQARAQAGCDDARYGVENAIENERAIEDRRRSAVNDLLQAYDMWRRDSDELSMPSGEDLAVEMEDWSRRADEESPLAKKVQGAELAARQRLHEERVRLQQETEATKQEQTEAERLIADLAAGFHEPPPLPFGTDEAARTARAGAPFWSLAEFSPSCLPEQRANIEAALQAAGLLNAWVTPDGSVLNAEFTDVLLDMQNLPEVAAEALDQVLSSDENRRGASLTVANDVIAGILKRIGYGEQNSFSWVASDGRWRNGALHGRCRKELAEYLGHSVREDHRARRLAVVETERQRLAEEAQRLEGQHRLLDERSALVARQVAAMPGDADVRKAVAAAMAAAQVTIGCRKSLTNAEQVVTKCRMKAEASRNLRDLDARDLGLAGWIGRLDELERHTTDYQCLMAQLQPSIEYLESLKVRWAETEAAVQEVQRDVTLFDEKYHEQQRRHAKAEERLKTLRETVGAGADEILRDFAAAEALRTNVQAEIKRARSDHETAGRQVARMEERIQSRQETVRAETDKRRLACDAFQRLCSQGFLKTALIESSDDDPSNWSVSRTVDTARVVETACSDISIDDVAWDRVQQSVMTKIQELNTVLSRHAFTPSLATIDNLYRVTVPYQARDRSIQELRDLLSEEVDRRRFILDEREREIIENHLIGEVSAQLHDQIYEAHALVDRMNAEIQRRPMSTGMTLKFDWQPDEELSPGIIEMCRKLLAAAGTWSPSERVAVGRCLQEHIKEVRASHEVGNWHEHLAEALDYRRWHRFWVMRKQDAGWKRLTKRTHGTGSGGEKAVALTIPQFAAAAAHYSSARPDAPRLILLDEAFVGVDPDMRGKCMELIGVFDLDFLLTSEIEWGCYEGFPGVAIHQLSTRSGFDAVFLTRWIWNGKQRRKDETPLPSATRDNSG